MAIRLDLRETKKISLKVETLFFSVSEDINFVVVVE